MPCAVEPCQRLKRFSPPAWNLEPLAQQPSAYLLSYRGFFQGDTLHTQTYLLKRNIVVKGYIHGVERVRVHSPVFKDSFSRDFLFACVDDVTLPKGVISKRKGFAPTRANPFFLGLTPLHKKRETKKKIVDPIALKMYLFNP